MAHGDPTDDNRPTIQGEGTAGDTIFVYVKDDMGDRLLGSTTVGGDGKWALRPDTALSTGKNEFTAVEWIQWATRPVQALAMKSCWPVTRHSHQPLTAWKITSGQPPCTAKRRCDR
ncbi:Ig-like domain-containing protein [Limnobaculum xujianqingii]|uniref:Ig-like domain-containing protein n=1 Tax=Limnobaculum xujianqingii TaxID=2738837 RepID=UPI0015BD6D83|nr:Ig-like domain-containing protein [Limnobaculum xujianqingii]